MTSRKILKKIRKIEVGTDGLLSQLLTLVSCQPAMQFRRISGAMPYGNHFNFRVWFINDKINRVWPARHLCPAALASDLRKPERVCRNRRSHLVHIENKPNTQSLTLAFVPGYSFLKFKSSFGVMNDPETHFLYLANVSSRNWFHETPRPGFLSASSARRSSSAICSGVSPSSRSTNSFSMRSTSSRRSALGIRRISSRICSALMSSIYPTVPAMQAAFSAIRNGKYPARCS
jgi:hypothetical protein